MASTGTPPPVAPDGDQPPRVIADRYRVRRFLGAGGFGTVYEAIDERLDKIVAVKLLGARRARSEGAIERFHAEALAASRLCHPNIVSTTDFDVLPDGRPFLVMEYASGDTLEHLIARVRPLPVDRVVRIARAVGAALAAAHAGNVVHRDLKPANIIVADELGGTTQDGAIVKILDFGVAKLAEGRTTPSTTHAGHIIGTPWYMAPEQIRAQIGPVDGRSDIYALGVVMYEMLTGGTPFKGPHVADVMMAHLLETPPPLSTERAEIPARLETIVLKALAKRPEQRFQSAAALVHALDLVLQAGPKANKPRRGRLLRRRLVPAALLAITIGLPSGGGPRPVTGVTASRRPDAAPWRVDAAPTATPARAPTAPPILPATVDPAPADTALAPAIPVPAAEPPAAATPLRRGKARGAPAAAHAAIPDAPKSQFRSPK